MNINWYPGHMAKSLRDLKTQIKLVDIIVEVLDSRIVESSSSQIMNELVKGKRKIIVLNKYDLSDNTVTNNWRKKFEKDNIPTVLVNAKQGKNIDVLVNEIKKIGNEINDLKYGNKRIEVKGITRVMIIGIPNVGKSSLINRLKGKNSLKVSNRPGVTLKKEWIRIDDNIELLDTPGLLKPKIEEDKGIKLALTGNIKDSILDIETLAYEGVKLLDKLNYLPLLYKRYKFEDDFEFDNHFEIIENLGRKSGCLKRGNEVDTERASKTFINDLREGRIGNISFE